MYKIYCILPIQFVGIQNIYFILICLDVTNIDEVEKIITTSSSPFRVTTNNLSSSNNSTPHFNNGKYKNLK